VIQGFLLVVVGMVLGVLSTLAYPADFEPSVRAQILLDGTKPQIRFYAGGQEIGSLSENEEGRTELKVFDSDDLDKLRETLDYLKNLFEAWVCKDEE
jgi:hypothetical protein